MDGTLWFSFLILSCLTWNWVYVVATVEDGDEFDSPDDYEDYSNPNSTNTTLVFTVGLRNVTRVPGRLVKLVCEVQNLLNGTNATKLSILWKRNEAPIESDGQYKIRTQLLKAENKISSTLRIIKLEHSDRSFVECIANNGVDKIRSQAYITTPDHYGGGVGGGFLPPKSAGGISSLIPDKFGEITTFLPNAVFKTDSTQLAKSVAPSPGLEFDYTPQEKMIFQNPLPKESLCQIYRGTRCHHYLRNQNVFVQPPFTQDQIEEKLDRAFLVISQSNDISMGCSKFAQPSLCFSAFPICGDAQKIEDYYLKTVSESQGLRSAKFLNEKLKTMRNNVTKSLRRICKDECMLLENEYCSKEYSIAKNHAVIGRVMELEECELLPSETHESSGNCLTLGVGDLYVNRDDRCYWNDGSSYKGTQDVSASGRKCIRWSHQFHVPAASHQEELAGHNYCRNPGQIESEPFCYIEQNKKELCGIERCEYVFGSYVVKIIIAIGILLLLIIAIWYCRCRKRIGRNLENKDLPAVSKNIYGNPGTSAPAMEMNALLPPHLPPQRNHHGNKQGLQTVPQYTYKEVRFLEELGEGAFGKVYKGELKTKQGKVFVAVKSLKENASPKTQADFQREIELISELKHPNIICLLGVVMKQDPMCMLFEFMSEGDLHEFLIANSPEEGKCLTHDQFLHIAIQIAQGMEYLSENHYVHRDLAARNCLVTKDMIVKISDFGLSRDMYSCDYYRVQSKSLLPVRWMPPESILYGKFTTESDVWSYGVVLWEIYSYGLQPYYGYNNQDVINMIRSRKLLPCPDACPSYCYSLMVECWAELATRRPNFSEIAHRLKVWKQSGPSNGSYFKAPSSAQPTPQKLSQSSSKTTPTASTAPQLDDQVMSLTWDREQSRQTRSASRHDSQSSLTSRTSSLGNNTQSTGLSEGGRRERRSRRNVDSIERLNPKNIVVSTNGDNFQTKLSTGQ